MNELICGRDVAVFIDRQQVLQAESAVLKVTVQHHKVRSCFCCEDIAAVEKSRSIKLHLTGIRLKRPYENCNFFDLDHFTVRGFIDGICYVLEGCFWDDFHALADKEKFREHISISALRIRKEEDDDREGS